MHKHVLNLSDLLDKKYFFLCGPRAVGKTTELTSFCRLASVHR